MSPLYKYNGKLLVKNNALAISENCCCENCADSCPIIITVDFFLCGRTNFSVDNTIASPYFVTNYNSIPTSIIGLVYYNEINEDSADFVADGYVTIACGEYGPGGETGWLVEIYLCLWCDADPDIGIPLSGQSWGGILQGFVAVGPDGCPEIGNIPVAVVGVPAGTAPAPVVTVTLS